MNSCSVFAPADHTKTLISYEQNDPAGTEALAIMHLQGTSYRNANPNATPAWITSNLFDTELNHNSTTLEGLDVASYTGSGGGYTTNLLSVTLV